MLWRFITQQKFAVVLSLIAAMAALGATVVSGISLVITINDRPPNPKPILRIIDMEAKAVLARDIDKVVNLFVEEAFVRDARGEASWSGQNEIRRRYTTLPKFRALRHTGVIVTFDNSENFARATGSTHGVLEMDTGALMNINSIDGERWTFERINGVWKITGFTFNIQ